MRLNSDSVAKCSFQSSQRPRLDCVHCALVPFESVTIPKDGTTPIAICGRWNTALDKLCAKRRIIVIGELGELARVHVFGKPNSPSRTSLKRKPEPALDARKK